MSTEVQITRLEDSVSALQADNVLHDEQIRAIHKEQAGHAAVERERAALDGKINGLPVRVDALEVKVDGLKVIDETPKDWGTWARSYRPGFLMICIGLGTGAINAADLGPWILGFFGGTP